MILIVVSFYECCTVILEKENPVEPGDTTHSGVTPHHNDTAMPKTPTNGGPKKEPTKGKNSSILSRIDLKI